MNKKFGFISLAVLLIAISLLGTMAYFTDTFSSDGNEAAAATFNVDTVNADGETIGDDEFDLDEKLYPGMDTSKVYEFFINKNETEVPVEYTVNLTPSGDLFPSDGSSPVELTLQRNIDDEWVDVPFSETFQPESDTESYQIFVDWPHGDNDIAFQSLTGNVALEVVATQVDASEGPALTGDISFLSTQNGTVRTTSGKEFEFYENEAGFKVIEVTMGDGDGDFEERVGNFTITEEDPANLGGIWLRVITEHDYFAGDAIAWRANRELVDLSTEGTVYFQGSGNTYLSIESDELYDWFTE